MNDHALPPGGSHHEDQFAQRLAAAPHIDPIHGEIYGDMEWLRGRIAGLEAREAAAQRADPKTLQGAVDAWGEAIVAELTYIEDVAARGATRQELRTLLAHAHVRISTYVTCIGGAVAWVQRRDDRS